MWPNQKALLPQKVAFPSYRNFRQAVYYNDHNNGVETLFRVKHIRFLPLSITWFKPDGCKAINIIGQVFEVSAVCVPNTNTCTLKYYIKTLVENFDINNKKHIYYLIYLNSTWSNCNCWKHVQHSFLDDLEAKGFFITRADRQRVKPINKFHFHSLVPYCQLDEV